MNVHKVRIWLRHFAYHNNSIAIDVLFMAMCVVSITLSLIFATIAFIDISIGLELPLLSLGLSGFREFLGAFPIRAVLLSAAFVVIGVRCADVVANRAKPRHNLLENHTLAKFILLVFPLIVAILIGILTPLDNKIVESDSFGGLRTFKTLKEKYILTGTVIEVLGDGGIIVRSNNGQIYEVTVVESGSTIVNKVEEGDFVATVVDQDTSTSGGSEPNPGPVSTTKPVVKNPTVPGVSPPPSSETPPPDPSPTPPPASSLTGCASDGRAVVDASGYTGTVVLDKANTIYDFKNVSANRDIRILASNVEACRIKGSGARRIGQRDGRDYVDSGFRDFEFTFFHVQIGGGGSAIRPYFINGRDVNPQPNIGDGDIMQLYAYQGGDIVAPLLDTIVAYGKQRPAGSDAHNDTIQFTSISGGRVYDPTIRNSTLEGASSASIQIVGVEGVLTLENNILSERFESYHAIIGSADKAGGTTPELYWKNNTLKNGASAALSGGWSYAPGSETNVPGVSVW